MRLRLGIASAVASMLLIGLGTAAPSASAAPQPCCATAPSVAVFTSGVPILDWRENLVFDGQGTMWVSNVVRGEVAGYAPDGSVKARVAVPSPGGLRVGHDGLIYVASGEIPISGATIDRFDPKQASPKVTTFARGLGTVNGMAEDSAGNFYTTAEFAGNVTKIRPDGSIDEAWSKAANVFGANGAFVDGDTLYVSVIVDLASTIERIPLANPATHSAVARLSPNFLNFKALDDLTVIGDNIYVVGFLTGELIRVDKHTGAFDVVANGLFAPTSVRLPIGFGNHDPQREVFVTEASGRIVDITLPQPTPQ